MKKTLSALLTVTLLTAPASVVNAADARTERSGPATSYRHDLTAGISDLFVVLAKDKDKDKDKDKERGKADESSKRGPEKAAPDRSDRGKGNARDKSPSPPSTPQGVPTDERDEKANDSKPRGNDKEKEKEKGNDKGSKNARTGDHPKPTPKTGPAPQPKSEPAPAPTPPTTTPTPASKPTPDPDVKPQPTPAGAAAAMKDRDENKDKGKSSKGRDEKSNVPKPKTVPATVTEKTTPRSEERSPMKQADTRDDKAQSTEPTTPGRGRMTPQKPATEIAADQPKQLRPNVQPPSKEVERMLKDERQRDRKLDAVRANRIDNQSDAANLIQSILGQAGNSPASQGRPHADDRHNNRHGEHGRLPVEQVGRTTSEREQTVDFLIRRFAGNASLNDAPPEFHSRRHTGDFDDRRPRSGGPVGRDGHIDHGPDHQHFHGPDQNRRVVCYPSRSDIPPVLLASVFLNRIQAQPLQQSAYRPGADGGNPEFYQNIPENYRSEEAYAVSYPVDPNSAVSREDIIFQQGSTALADSYSYDLVVDLAEAMKAPALQNEKFVIEGHASAEGDYSSNLRLSQERSERIARDLVDMGVDPDRLLPVGYGEAEAQYPADGAERLRSMDRRVVVFRMTDPGQ